LIGALLALSALHTLPPLMAASVAIGGLLWRRGERVWSWLLPVALLGGACLNMALKEAFQRQRPAFSGLAAELHSYSFPSGHAAHATVFYGLLALLAWQGLRHRPGWRGLATGAALLMAALVMAARVLLGVHYLADVLAGLLVGIAWLGVLLAILLPAPMRPFGLKR
ncbi:MAG TPA: phosphatase PAP2 family protein, partial [Ideonella sp.]|nr:phosphatase PAP2 family protein [Ideonella sp.]